MAIFYLSVQTIRRAAGRSVTAAAAYRAGQKIYDERTQTTFDYRRRSGVVGSGLVGWSGTREDLWNKAERSERRKNSVVGREIVLALPYELSAESSERLVLKYCEWLHEKHGVAVDWAVHEPSDAGDHRNIHAHLLLTTRRVIDDQFGEKTRELDTKQSSSSSIEEWRKTWARFCNVELMLADVEGLMDHRSYERQAKASGTKAKIPQQHLGPKQTQLLRNGAFSEIARRNLSLQQQYDQSPLFGYGEHKFFRSELQGTERHPIQRER